MFAAVLTTFLFALSAIFARRSTLLLGSQRANLARQLVALVALSAWAHTLGQGFTGPSRLIFFASGMVGFGMGDWALFEAFPRLGPALTVLLCQCLAAPIAAVTEWLWLGIGLTGIQIVSSATILLGVVLAIAPARDNEIPLGHRLSGIGFGLMAAAGQGWGAVLSRYAFLRAETVGFHVDGITSAYQRLWGGALSLGLLLLLQKGLDPCRSPNRAAALPDWKRGFPWVLANALVGASLGVSCYQWALQSTPSAIVLPIVATTPLVVILLVYLLESGRPSLRTILGSLIAVSGVVLLVLNR